MKCMKAECETEAADGSNFCGKHAPRRGDWVIRRFEQPFPIFDTDDRESRESPTPHDPGPPEREQSREKEE